MDGLSFILYCPLEGNIPQHEPLEARIYFSRLLPLEGGGLRWG